MKRYSFFNLLGNAFLRLAVGWIERIVVAIGAAACTLAAVTVRTTETGVERDFLHALPEGTAEVFSVRIVPSLMAPGVRSFCHRIKKKRLSQKSVFFSVVLCDSL